MDRPMLSRFGLEAEPVLDQHQNHVVLEWLRKDPMLVALVFAGVIMYEFPSTRGLTPGRRQRLVNRIRKYEILFERINELADIANGGTPKTWLLESTKREAQ